MRIAVNADCLAEPHSSAARYLAQLLAALGMVDGVNDYALLSSQPIPTLPPLPSTFSHTEMPVSGPNEPLRRVRWEQRAFPEAARKLDAKALFVPSFAPPLRAAAPVVVALPDLTPLALPEYRALSPSWLYLQWLTQNARRAARIIALSDYAKSEIIRFLNVRPDQVLVINSAPDARMRLVSDAGKLREIRARYQLGERFLLYTGEFDARGNVSLLIGAFAAALNRMGDPSLKLVIAGDPALLGTSPLYPDWRRLPRKFGIESRVVNAQIATEDLPAVYSAALACVYPAQYDSFGMPAIEALACGAPLVISDHPALREATDGAALTFPLGAEGDPTLMATRALADQITRLVQTPELREEYRQRGLARARFFSWTQAAVDTSGVFADVAGMRY